MEMESPETDNEKSVSVQSSNRSRSFYVAQVALRTLALASSVVALCVTVTSGMSVLVYGIIFEARYSYSSANRFLMGVDSAVSGLSALSLLSLYFLSRVESNVKNHLLLFLHDLAVMVLAMAGCAAATAVGSVAKFGDQRMGWIAVCDEVPRFCNRIAIAIAFSYVAFMCYFALCLSSVNRLVRVSSSSSSSSSSSYPRTAMLRS